MCWLATFIQEKEQKNTQGKRRSKVYSLDEILASPVNGSGYNEQYGLLGSNKATETSVKLFPRNCQELVDGIQKDIKEKTGKTVEVLVYGDGAFRIR